MSTGRRILLGYLVTGSVAFVAAYLAFGAEDGALLVLMVVLALPGSLATAPLTHAFWNATSWPSEGGAYVLTLQATAMLLNIAVVVGVGRTLGHLEQANRPIGSVLAKPARAAGVLVAGVIVMLVGLLGIPMWRHQWQMWRFERSVRYLALPDETRVLGTRRAFGLMGNGNHCDATVTALLESRLEPARVAEVFKERSLPVAYPFGDEVMIEVEAVDGRPRQYDHLYGPFPGSRDYATTVDELVQEHGGTRPGHRPYVALFYDSTYDSLDLMDLRCN